MRNNIFIEQPRRGKTHEVLITPHKAAGRSVGMVAVILLVLSVLVTACSKPEKKLLAGTWRWVATTNSVASEINYTTESEGFEAEIVFKGNKFTFYKDGKKITSGNYQIDEWEPNEDIMPHPDVLFHSMIRFPETQCETIAKATDGIISFDPSSVVLLDIITDDYQSLMFHSSSLVDYSYITFAKKK